MIPEDPEIQIHWCIPLTVVSCIVLCQKKEEVHISLTSNDLNNNNFKLTSNTYRIPNCVDAWKIGISMAAGDIIFKKMDDEKSIQIYQLNVDHSVSNFKLNRVFSVPTNTYFHRIINEHCYFVQLGFKLAWIEHIAICDKNGSLTMLENSKIQLDYNSEKIAGVGVSFTFY